MLGKLMLDGRKTVIWHNWTTTGLYCKDKPRDKPQVSSSNNHVMFKYFENTFIETMEIQFLVISF